MNHTEKRIIDESTLIQVFRDLHLTFERNLALGHLTTRHADPSMTSTFQALLRYYKQSKPHVRVQGRSSKHEIKDMVDKGQQALYKTSPTVVVETAVDGPPADDPDIALEDVTIEVGV